MSAEASNPALTHFGESTFSPTGRLTTKKGGAVGPFKRAQGRDRTDDILFTR